MLSTFICLSSAQLHWHLSGSGWRCCQRTPPSVGRVARAEWMLCLLRVSQKLFHCPTFSYLATLLNTSVFSSMCALVFMCRCGLFVWFVVVVAVVVVVVLCTTSLLSVCQSTLPVFLSSTNWLDNVFLSRISSVSWLCNLTALTSHLCQTYHT